MNPVGRLGCYGTKKGYLFDVAIYIELDNDFNPVGIWHMGVDDIKTLEKPLRGKTGLHVRDFKNNAERMDI